MSELPNPLVASGAVRAGPLPAFLVPAVGFLRRHPVVALLLLTPGIPEYLSSSSSLDLAFQNPVLFLLFLGANVGMYLPGALLIREAMIRWKKGYGTVIALGAAYAIVEEGIGLNTIFNSHASVVGGLGFFGHWLGVNWVWLPGVIMIHVVYSISIPIVLLGYALPELRGRSILTDSGIRYAVAVLITDITLLFLLVDFGFRFFMGVPVLIGALLAIAGLIFLARTLPADLVAPTNRSGSVSPVGFGLVGAALFPGTIVLQGFSEHFGVPPVLTIAGLLVFYAALFGTVHRWVARATTDRQILGFITGALVPISVLGLFGSFPATIVASSAMAYFLYRLWNSYGVHAGPDRVPRAARPGAAS